MLSKYDSGPINKKIIDWVRNHIQKENLCYKFMFCSPYMFESELIDFNNNVPISEDDNVLWNPIVASRNIEFVTRFKNSVVILENQTILNEKISQLNPINENQAVNHCFYIMYLNEEPLEHKEWKIAVQENNYLMTQKNLLKAFKDNPNNIKENSENIPDIFDDKNSFNLKQVNFDD